MKRVKKKNSSRWIIILCVLLLVIAAGFICVMLFPRQKNENNKHADEQLPEFEMIEVDPTYITDTIYDGDEELNPILFAYPFGIYETYIRNKELAKILDEEMLSDLQKRASDFAISFYNIDSRNTIQHSDSYDQELNNFLISGSDTLYADESIVIDQNEITYSLDTGTDMIQLETEDFIATYIEAVCNSGIRAEASFQTNKALVWEDTSYLVRGLLELRVYSVNDMKDLQNFFPFKIKGGETYHVVVDIGLVPVSSMKAETYKVISWNEVAYYDSTGEVNEISADKTADEVMDLNVESIKKGQRKNFSFN